MSKICGIWHFDWHPASREDETRIRAALDIPGYFNPQLHWGPGILCGWAAGSDVPQSVAVSQQADRSICLWDGRLDNHADLLRQTGLAEESSAGDIALALYRKNGLNGLGDLVGDWSLCLWDASRREMVLASDYAGIRPLYHHRSPKRLCFSSSLADLVEWTGLSELDDVFAGGFLLGGGHPTRTPYAGIAPVPAGHAVTTSPEATHTRPFWDLPITRETRYPDERQYEERLLELFREAVRVRIESRPAACAELSGGLDSSSIACMADRLRKEEPERVPAVTTFSYTHENCLDERFFREVERACNLPSRHFDISDNSLIARDIAGVNPTWWEPRFRMLSRLMGEMGAGTLLTGQLGDAIMGNTPDDASQITESLAKGRLAKATREAYAFGRAMQVPLYPVLWRSMREAWFGWTPPVDPQDATGAIPSSREDSFTAAFRARIEEQRPADRPWREIPAGRRLRFRGTSEMLQSRRLQTPEALQHLSCTHPYTHRPLLEFMLTVPPGIAFGPKLPRRLMRRAFRELLPPMILNRRSKGEFGTVYREVLLPLAGELLRNPARIQLVERGILDRQSLISRLERFNQGLDSNEGQLRGILLFEFWLKNRTATQPRLKHAGG